MIDIATLDKKETYEDLTTDRQVELGLMYYFGRGVSQDYAKALVWFRRAAEQEYDHAQYMLGEMYYFGKGVPEDDAEAVAWYLRAAEQGHPRGQYQLGMMYYFGKGVPKDYTEAFTWLSLAAEQGDARAQYLLGEMYKKEKKIIMKLKSKRIGAIIKVLHRLYESSASANIDYSHTIRINKAMDHFMVEIEFYDGRESLYGEIFLSDEEDDDDYIAGISELNKKIDEFIQH